MQNVLSRTNCSESTSSTNTKVVQFGQKLFHRNGHELILESHDESARNAFIYIGLILVVYIMAVIAIAVRYLLMRSNRDSMPCSPPYQYSTARRSTVSLFSIILLFLLGYNFFLYH